MLRIGYPCINTSVGCTANRTLRLGSYTKPAVRALIRHNLECLHKILEYNLDKGFHFFRIGSGLIPLASHPVSKINWAQEFRQEFRQLGTFIRKNHVRISMHPGQYTVLNARDKKIVKNAVADLAYHTAVLDALGLDSSAKVQIHVGGVYDDKEASIKRFVSNYRLLSPAIKKRLIVENDEKSYDLRDCLRISRATGVPVILDVFHHECKNKGESFKEALKLAACTWRKKDGPPIVDYSSQAKGQRKGSHSRHIDTAHFQKFVKATKGVDIDVMLEIKDKEKSALKALQLIGRRV